MKVVHVIDYFQPTVGYQEIFLVREHVKMGHDVTVLTSDRYFPFKNFEEVYEPILGKRIVGESIQKTDGYTLHRIKPLFELSSLMLSPQYYNKLLEIKPDFVIYHEVLRANIFYVLKAKDKLNFKLITDSHSAKYNADFSTIDKKIYMLFWRKMVLPKLVNIKAFTNGFNENELLKELAQGKLDPEVVPLGADLDRFKPDKKLRNETRKELGIDDNDVLLINAGKLNKGKKIELVINTFKSLSDRYKNLKLLLIGNPEQDVKRLIDQNSEIIHINFLPNEELPKYFAASDIGVWPGSKSIIFVEAIASGLPLILDSMPFSKDVLSNKNGFNIGDESEFEDLVEKLISNPDLRKEMGKNSRKLAEQKYDWAKIANYFLKA